ncbi:MAG: M50 family metallopeptidase [Candidatus Riflebacteria bacterium]|nr:M50 family metallopeptidase [Candidatus Riflebacteria bacterium]
MDEPFPFPDLPPVPPPGPVTGPGGPAAPGDRGPRLPLGGMGLPLILFVLSVWFWESPVVYPVKLLTVFFHELSHGLAAVATGGSMHSIELTADQGGLCWTAGGIWWVILSAGYLGSLVWGAGLLYAAAKTRYDRELVQFLGGLLIVVTAVYVRTWAGVAFGLGFGAAMLAFASQFGEVACDQLLRYIGLTSSFYVILDIKSDLIDRNLPQSDAYRLAEMLHLPGWVVGVAWFLLAIWITFRVLEATMRQV